MKPQYSARLRKIEETIVLALPEKIEGEWLEGLGGRVGRLLPATSLYEGILAPARDLIGRGGKRWRPMLMLLSGELCGNGDRTIPLIPLVELAHNGSLIVDDIEDRAQWRRGAPSVHVLYGEDMAINSGNLLYFLPTFLIDRGPFTSEERAAIYRIYSEEMRRLHLGQGLDIQWHRDHSLWPTEEEYLQMCRLKTGSLARMAARLGSLVAGGDPSQVALLGETCESMGLAFQILDDVMNLTTGNPGKRRGDDIVEGKKSLPVVIHATNNPGSVEPLKRMFEQAEKEGPLSPAVEEAIAHLGESIAMAKNVADQLLKDASSKIERSFPSSEASDLLVGMLEGFLA